MCTLDDVMCTDYSRGPPSQNYLNISGDDFWMSEKGFKSLELCSQEYKLCMRKSEDLVCKDYFGGILSQNDMKSLGDATWMSE